MQPFDAVTLQAILKEVRPRLLHCRVEKVQQSGRDEVVLSLRSRNGTNHLLLSAHVYSGRLCLVAKPPASSFIHHPNFSLLLRKHLTGATLLAVEQYPGERIVDVVFSCLDEVGGVSCKVLTVEIMGRHSNLIFWDKESQKIITASHVVNSQMSRQRQVGPGLTYARPPRQSQPNIFRLAADELGQHLEGFAHCSLPLAHYLLTTFCGLGRHLAQELSQAAINDAGAAAAAKAVIDALVQRALKLQQNNLEYRPAMHTDQTSYTVLSWLLEQDTPSHWEKFSSVNDLVANYYRQQEAHERFQQLQKKLDAELKSQTHYFQLRLEAANHLLAESDQIQRQKKFGDLILTHIADIEAGQAELICEDIFVEGSPPVHIALNPNLTPSQNAQNYYRHFSKAQARQSAAQSTQLESATSLKLLEQERRQLESARTIEDLESIKESLPGKRLPEKGRKVQPAKAKSSRSRSRLLSVLSLDGWTIYLGRNRQENDELISQLAQPQDIWMHVLGQGGAHVLIKVPSTKQDPPASTLKEAAQFAARLSKAAAGSKVRVVYTQCRHVKKIARAKAGLVTYQNEKTLEVDTALPMPDSLRKLFKSQNLRKRPTTLP